MPHDNQTELFWLVDENDNELGSITRKLAHADRNNIHRSVDIILRSGDEILLQKRSRHKDTFPDHWSISSSGHVNFGETYEKAAIRELREEIGVEGVKLKKFGKKLFDTGIEQEYSTLFMGEYNGNKFKLDETEVSEVRWAKINELQQFVDENPVSPGALAALSFAGFIVNKSK